MKRVIKGVFFTVGILCFIILIANVLVINTTTKRIYTNIDQIPFNNVALVLGTSHRLQNGDSNMFFFQRIEQTVKLYKKGKVGHIIVSGDNSSKYYNEPQRMRNALIKQGVPDSVITMDFAGFRTLDSVVRSKLIFGQNRITIVTQDFHSYRALYIAEKNQIDAVASVASPLPWNISIKVELREIMARVVALWDLFVVGRAPRFLGDKEIITN